MGAVCVRLGAVAAVLLGGISRLKSEDLADLVEKVEPAVVQVKCDHGSFGSGVVIDADGTVATNYHVIEGTRHAQASFRDGKSLPVLGYLAIDPGHDLAILKLEIKHRKLSSVPLALNLPRKGEKVAAFGAPKGLTFTTSEGIVSAVRVGTDSAIAGDFTRLGYERNATWVQTTAAISPGNSGGPLINMNGQIVGLNTLTMTTGSNLNFAISVNDLRALSARAGNIVQDLATLPKPRRETTIVTSNEFKVKFPSGRVLSSLLIKMDPQLIRNAMKKGSGASISNYPGGTTRDVAFVKNGVLNGAAFMHYETGELKLYATYEDGKKHGPLSLFDDDHHLVYWGQFDKGKRDGLAFIVENGDIRLVAEYHVDKMEAVHLLNDLAIEKSFKDKDEAAQNETAKPLLDKLADVDGQLKKYETELKKQVYADAQKAQKERKDKAKPRGSR